VLEKTYRATRYADALAQAKRDLGETAMILAARELPGDAGMPSVEITAVASRHVSGHGSALVDILVRADVPEPLARSLARLVSVRLGRAPMDLAEARAPLAAALATELSFVGPRDDAARVVAVVGPTGVGKTTTVAKIAAHTALVARQRVAIVCMDHYRIGAVEQVERYAELIGCPLLLAEDGPSLRRALSRVASADLVLVDTEGRAPGDGGPVQDLAHALHEEAGERVDVHLCLAAATREAELAREVRRLAPLRPSRLCVTKLDEAVTPGGVLVAQQRSGLPLGWVGTGQRVPEDVLTASPAWLAGVLCDERSAA